jgi:hypothetical protein
MSTTISLTRLAQRFLQPRNSTQRVYEALRAFCVDRVPAREALNASATRQPAFACSFACRVGNGYEKAKSRPKVMPKYHQRGIFTINQLSYLFKPRVLHSLP